MAKRTQLSTKDHHPQSKRRCNFSITSIASPHGLDLRNPDSLPLAAEPLR